MITGKGTLQHIYAIMIYIIIKLGITFLLKILVLYLLPDLFTSYLLTILKQWILLPSIWKFANIVIRACLNIIKRDLIERVLPTNVPCLFMFWPIMLKQLRSLTSIDTFSCHDGMTPELLLLRPPLSQMVIF